MESEYYALTESIKRSIWTKKIIKEFFSNFSEQPINVYEDNEAVIKFSKGNATLHKRTMHIDRKGFFVRDNIQKNIVDVKSISSSDNIADVFTKPLRRTAFEKHRAHLCAPNDK